MNSPRLLALGLSAPVALLFYLTFSVEGGVASTTPTASSPKTVVALLSLSGDYAPLGQAIQQGIELAKKESDESSQGVQVLYEDIGTVSPRKAVSAVQMNLAAKRAEIFLAAFADEVRPLVPIVDKARVPLLTVWDSSEQALSRSPFLFSTGFSIEKAGAAAAELAWSRKKNRNAVVIGHQAGWSTEVGQAFTIAWKEKGGTVVAVEYLDPQETDYHSVLARVKALQPGVMYFPLVTNPARFLKQARQLDVKAVLVTGDTMLIPGELESAGAAAEGVLFTAVYSDEGEDLCVEHDAEGLDCAADALPFHFGYSGMKIALEALEKAQNDKEILAELELLLGEERSLARKVRGFQVEGGRVRVLPEQ